jgi:hypothetical protein
MKKASDIFDFDHFRICSFQGTCLTGDYPVIRKRNSCSALLSLTNLSGCFTDRLWARQAVFKKVPGSRLLSHAVTSIVSSAAYGLTIVFGMGTGVSHTRIATGSGLK